MKNIIKINIVAFIFTLLIATTVSSRTIIDKKNPVKQGTVLTILQAKNTRMVAAKHPHSYKLTLQGVNPKVIYFSNHPARFSGHVSVQKYIAKWNQGIFKHDAPNAIIEIVDLTAKKNPIRVSNFTVELLHPHYSQRNRGTLTFIIKPIGSTLTLPRITKSDYVSLFVDDVCISCIG